MAIVTLLTDFGVSDTYVGQMKGAILSLAPAVTLVDLTHAVPPQDVFAGAFLLWTAVSAFTRGTIHLGVVDPGVGSARRAIALASQRGDVLIGPDNGLLLPAAARLGGIATAIALPTPAAASATFHGRDIFAPAAARVATGVSLTDLGTPITDLVQLSLPEPTEDAGEVIHVDTYGNLITNIPAPNLRQATGVSIGDVQVPLVTHYAEAEPHALVALVGSAGLLEISVRDGSAAAQTRARRGAAVRLLLKNRRRPRE